MRQGLCRRTRTLAPPPTAPVEEETGTALLPTAAMEEETGTAAVEETGRMRKVVVQIGKVAMVVETGVPTVVQTGRIMTGKVAMEEITGAVATTGPVVEVGETRATNGVVVLA